MRKQGPAVFMILQDKIKEAVLELEVNEISSASGVKVIADSLDKIFLKRQNTNREIWKV